MLKQFTILCIASLLLTACYGYDAPKKPENLIPKSIMVNMLLDLNIISAFPNNEDKKKLVENNVLAAQYVYKKYNIDSLQFALSNNYYAFYVEEYEDIYIKIKDSLEVLKEQYKTKLDEEIQAKRKSKKEKK